jgi:hypothetical protein
MMTMDEQTQAPEGPTQIEVIYQMLMDANGAELRSSEIVDRIWEMGYEWPKSSLTATLPSLLDNGKRPGIIRTEVGVYAYRPGEKSTDIPRRPGGLHAKRVYAELKRVGVATVAEIMTFLPDLTRKQVGQALVSMAKSHDDVERVDAGKYRYISSNGHKPTPAVLAEFQPLVEAIPDWAFNQVGLNVVARTKDGDRVAIDEKGGAWTVKVTVEATLI